MVRGDKSWVYDEAFKGPHELGWKQFDIVDLAAVATLPKNLWWPKLEVADVILVGGGNVPYLSFWMQASGLAEALPQWLETKVYVGNSAGSMVVTPSINTSSEALQSMGLIPGGEDASDVSGEQMSDVGIGLVTFGFRPHFGENRRSSITAEVLDAVAKQEEMPVYALDDKSALSIFNGEVTIVSEGDVKLFEP
jgi:dipeptidase E